MTLEYPVQTVAKTPRSGEVLKAKVAGTKFRLLLTPIEGIADFIGVTVDDQYTLVTLLEYPWTSYPFVLPLSDHISDIYILEKLYSADPGYKEQAQKLCYLLKHY